MKKASNKSAAVRQQKAPVVQEADTPEQALYRALNFFPSPPWAARAGAELLKELDPDARVVWEPACGEGHAAEPIIPYFSQVMASDIHDHGYGVVQDFLLDGSPPFVGQVDWIFTNPPFALAEAFVRQGLKVARRGVALLLRIAFLEGEERYPVLYQGNNPLTVVAPFIERVPMVLGCYDPAANTPLCVAWFYFQKGQTIMDLARGPRVRPFPPGTKARLHRTEDVRRFAKLAPAPLFESLKG